MQLTLWTYEGPPHVGAMRAATALKDVHHREDARTSTGIAEFDGKAMGGRMSAIGFARNHIGGGVKRGKLIGHAART